MSLLQRIALLLAVAALSGSAGVWAAPQGQPWHRTAHVEKALAKAAFKAVTRGTPIGRAAYGLYKVGDFSLSVTDTRIDQRNVEIEADLMIVNEDAAGLRALVSQGRYPSRDPEACARDPDPCILATRLRHSMETLPGGTGRFIGRALADRRTLYVAARNLAESRISKWIGKGIVRGQARYVTPVLRASPRSIAVPSTRTQWAAIEEIAERADRVTDRTFEVLLAELVKLSFRQIVASDRNAAVQDFERRYGAHARNRNYDADFRLRMIEAPRLYLPLLATPTAPALPLRRAPDPVIDRAIVQSQIAQQFGVARRNEPVSGQVSPPPPPPPRRAEPAWRPAEERSTRMPEIRLPSSAVDFDGRFR